MDVLVGEAADWQASLGQGDFHFGAGHHWVLADQSDVILFLPYDLLLTCAFFERVNARLCH